jgi:hypothetical protein
MPIVLSPQADPVSPAVEMLSSKERCVHTYATSIGQGGELDLQRQPGSTSSHARQLPKSPLTRADSVGC